MTALLSGKVALVTGGARGIGAATARALAGAGADVAISYASSADAAEAVARDLRALGVEAKAFKADQSEPQQASDLVDRVVEAFGGLDIYVANAAAFAVGPVTAVDRTALDAMWRVNTTGTIEGIRAAARILRDDGRIIAMSTDLVARIGGPNLADYTGSKAAIEGFVKGAAHDLAPRRITCNLLRVGPVDTDMNPQDGEISDWLKSIVALGRYAHADEIAAVVAFLASPNASYITGGLVPVHGGGSA